MPKLRRVAPICVVGLIIAGCASAVPATETVSLTAPTLAPPTVAPPTVTPTSVTSRATVSPSSPQATFGLLQTTFEGCPGVDAIEPDNPFVDADASIGRLNVDLQVTRIEERSGQLRSVTPPTRELNNEGTRLLLGGHEFLTSPSSYYEGYDPPITMESASVTMTLDGGSASALPIRFVPGNENYNQAAVAVPDVSGHGILAFSFTWTDRCFRLEASGSVQVNVVSAATTAGCELEEAAYWSQLGALFEHGLNVASHLVDLGSPRNESKYAPYVNPGIDAFIVYAFDRDDPAVPAAPGSALRVGNPKPGLALSDMELAVFTRQSVTRAIKDYPPHGTELVLERSPAQHADGSWRLRVPAEPGRYVATIEFKFDSECSSGTAWAVVNIDVVAASPT
jgi:hypothetical protein